jgi:predicted O-methyltransferase YrrM
MAFAFLSLLSVLTAFLLLLAYTIRTGISPVPTTPRVAAVMLDLAGEPPPGRVYELGAGWGNLAQALARRFPDRSVVAYEISPLPYLFFRADLGDAALVCCYLYPGAMRRLAPKLERELRPGALVVSNSFLVPGWEPEATRTSDDQYGTPVYLYRRPSS